MGLIHPRPGGLVVYNANYAVNGGLFLSLIKPWTVTGTATFRTFQTHAEAIHWAHARARTFPPVTPVDRAWEHLTDKQIDILRSNHHESDRTNR